MNKRVLFLVTVLSVSLLTWSFAAVGESSLDPHEDIPIEQYTNIEKVAGSLDFSGEAKTNVEDPTWSGTAWTDWYIFKFESNYDVHIKFDETAFTNKNDNTLPTTWTLEPDNTSTSYTKGNMGWEAEGAWQNVENLADAKHVVSASGTKSYVRVKASATRNGLEDPPGKYEASLEVKVVGEW